MFISVDNVTLLPASPGPAVCAERLNKLIDKLFNRHLEFCFGSKIPEQNFAQKFVEPPSIKKVQKKKAVARIVP